MGYLIETIYFLTAVLFIVGLKRMSHPTTARSGIVWAGYGMVLATVVSFVHPQIHRAYRDDQLCADGDRHCHWRRDCLVGCQEGADDRHAADDRHLQWHGWRRGGGDCCGGVAQEIMAPGRRKPMFSSWRWPVR
jgi:hypothetical protein